MTQEQVKIRQFNDSAVVTSRIKLEKGPRSHGLTNVYVSDRPWRCVASQASWIGAAKTLQPSLTTKGVESLQLTGEEQSTSSWRIQEKLFIAESQNVLLREDLKNERETAELIRSQGAGAQSRGAGWRTTTIGGREVGRQYSSPGASRGVSSAQRRNMSSAYDRVSNA